MNQKEKLLERFLENPCSLKYFQIESVLHMVGFIKIGMTSSHIKWKFPELRIDLIFPIHNHDCKNFYKKDAAKAVKKLLDFKNNIIPK
jgi:hypothetical protein